MPRLQGLVERTTVLMRPIFSDPTRYYTLSEVNGGRARLGGASVLSVRRTIKFGTSVGGGSGAQFRLSDMESFWLRWYLSRNLNDLREQAKIQ